MGNFESKPAYPTQRFCVPKNETLSESFFGVKHDAKIPDE